MHTTTTTLFSALLALPLVLAAPNFRLHPGTVRRSAREPREWRQDEPAAAAAAAPGSRFVRLDMRRKAPTHNLVPGKDDDAAPVEKRATTIVIDDGAAPTSSGDIPISSLVPISSDSGTTLTISDDIGGSPTSSFAEASKTPSPARVNATAMLKDVAYGVKSESPLSPSPSPCLVHHNRLTGWWCSMDRVPRAGGDARL